MFTFQCTFVPKHVERFALYYTIFYLSTLFDDFFIFLYYFLILDKIKTSNIVCIIFINCNFITNSFLFISFVCCKVLFYNTIFFILCQYIFLIFLNFFWWIFFQLYFYSLSSDLSFIFLHITNFFYIINCMKINIP